jgi:hypothetical protein
MVHEAGGFKLKVSFKDFYSPETVATTSTATDSKFGLIDDDVLVRSNPCYIGTTPEMSSTGRLAEETDLIGSKTVKKIFLDDTVPEAAGGRITDSSLGHLGLAMATPDISHDSTFRGCHPSSNKNHSGIDIGHCVKENTPLPRNVVNG